MPYLQVKLCCEGVCECTRAFLAGCSGRVALNEKAIWLDYSLLSNLCQRLYQLVLIHNDIIKLKYFPYYWPFVRGIHRSPVNSPHTSQWHGSLMSSLICAGINGWVNNHEAGDLRCHRPHYDIIIMFRHTGIKIHQGKVKIKIRFLRILLNRSSPKLT